MCFCYLNQARANIINIVIVLIINNTGKQHKTKSKIHSLSEMFLITRSFQML